MAFGITPPKSPVGGLPERKCTSKCGSKRNDTPRYITALARKGRLTPTPQEEKLWEKISCRKLGGMKFRRQFPIGRYIADFYNHAHRLVIEIDGGIHNHTKAYDFNRDEFLRAGGYKVLRFKNSQIDNDVNGVISEILQFLNSPPTGD